jgi:predicted RNA-binding protein
MSYWLLVERLENWEVDKKEGFCRFGIPNQRRGLADQMKSGDKLVFYVSGGISKFSDIRELTADGTFKLGTSGAYDTAFPLSIATKPSLTLNFDRWVPIKDLLTQLSFTADKSDWRLSMRTTVRRLTDDDAKVIIEAMNSAAKAD